jgi:hypothetical protein
MAIKRYTADADNTITNAFKADLTTRGTGANMGAADVLEVFSILGQASSSADGLSKEKSRAIVQFPISTIKTDRDNGTLPESGSVSFYLRMFNARHSQTLPKGFTLSVQPVSSSWQEGTGLDMENYTDLTYGGTGSTWINASSEDNWVSQGGDYYTDAAITASQNFDIGTEDLEVNVSEIVERQIKYIIEGDDGGVSTLPNYGFGIMLTGSQEDDSTRGYYTKKFFARSSEYFYKRPIIEARWDSSKRDDRGNFYYSSSLAPAEDNVNTLYLYNYVRGQLRNIPEIGTTGSIMVSLYSGSANDTAPSGSALELSIGGGVTIAAETFATGGWYNTGVYTCSVAITASSTPIATLYDVWSTGSIVDGDHIKTRFHTGSITPELFDSSNYNPDPSYVVALENLKPIYSTNETARFRLYVREKDWNPTIYTRAVAEIENYLIESASYMIYRITDELEVIPYGTGSDSHTHLSFDVSGNYFDLDMGLFEPDYGYAIKFCFYNGSIGSWVEQPDTFKFRVQ